MKKNRGFVSIEVVVIASIILIAGVFGTTKFVNSGNSAQKEQETAYSKAINGLINIPPIGGGTGGGSTGGGGNYEPPGGGQNPPGGGQVPSDTIIISFDTDGGELLEAQQIKKGGKLSSLPKPIKDGHTFLGWYIGGTKVNTNTVFEESATLTAKWETGDFTITVHYRSKASSNLLGSETITARYGSKKEYTGPVLNGYTSNPISINFVKENKNVYLDYTPIQYKINYNLDGGTNGENPTSYTVEDSITLKSPTKQNYDFRGWTGSNGSSPNVNVNIPSGSTGDKTYTANWQGKNCTVTINYKSSKSQKLLKTDTVNGRFGTSIAYNGKSINGYNRSEIKIAFDAINKSVDLYYNPVNYSITYNYNGGSGNNRTQYTIEDSFTLSNPTKNNSDFTGWTGSNGGTPQTSVSISAGTTGNKSYTANWNAKTQFVGIRKDETVYYGSWSAAGTQSNEIGIYQTNNNWSSARVQLYHDNFYFNPYIEGNRGFYNVRSILYAQEAGTGSRAEVLRIEGSSNKNSGIVDVKCPFSNGCANITWYRYTDGPASPARQVDMHAYIESVTLKA